MTTLEPHPLSKLFPPISPEDFDKLAADIKLNGLHQAIVLYQGKILDGNNRHRACELVRIAPKFADFNGDDAQARNYVISANIHRRHLSPDQRREIIATLLKADPNQSNRQIADAAKASHVTVGAVRAELEATGQIDQLEKTTGADGKKRKRNPKVKGGSKGKAITYQEVVDGKTARNAYHVLEEHLLDALQEINDRSSDKRHRISDVNLERKLSDIKQYLLDHVRKEPGPLGDDCWIWTLSLSEGYGQLHWNGFGGRAHRVSYQAFVEPIPAGRQVQHKCDRKDCINPKHLGLGVFATNRADVFSQGEPELTPHEFERLCAELADLDRKAEVTDLRRAQIAAQLRRTIRDNRDERRTVIKERPTTMEKEWEWRWSCLVAKKSKPSASECWPVTRVFVSRLGHSCPTLTARLVVVMQEWARRWLLALIRFQSTPPRPLINTIHADLNRHLAIESTRCPNTNPLSPFHCLRLKATQAT